MIWHQSSKLLVTCNTKKVKIIDAEFPLKIYFYLISRCFPLISILSNSVKNPQSQKPSSCYFKHCQLLCPAMISLAFLLYGWVQKRNVSVILEQFVSRWKKKKKTRETNICAWFTWPLRKLCEFIQLSAYLILHLFTEITLWQSRNCIVIPTFSPFKLLFWLHAPTCCTAEYSMSW